MQGGPSGGAQLLAAAGRANDTAGLLVQHASSVATAAAPQLLCVLGEACGLEPSDPPSPAVKECFGAHCFRLTFILMAIMCGVGVCLNLVLVMRTRPVYASLYGATATAVRPREDDEGLRKEGSNSNGEVCGTEDETTSEEKQDLVYAMQRKPQE